MLALAARMALLELVAAAITVTYLGLLYRRDLAAGMTRRSLSRPRTGR